MKLISILALVSVAVSLFGCAATHQSVDYGFSPRQPSSASHRQVVVVEEEASAESEPVAPKSELSTQAEALIESWGAQGAANAIYDEAMEEPAAPAAPVADRQVQADRVVFIAYSAPKGWQEMDKDVRGLNVVAVFDDGSGNRIVVRYESESDMKSVVDARLKRHELPGCTEMHAGYNEEGDMAMGYRVCGDGYTTAVMLSVGRGTYTITGIFPVSMYAAGNQAMGQLVASLKVDPINWGTASGQTAKADMGPVD